MTHLAIWMLNAPDLNGPAGLWLFLSIGAVVLFVVFLPTMSWIDNRRREREAYYRAETLRRLAEASGEGAMAAVELLREQDRLERIKRREGLKIGGVVNLCIGIALVIFLRGMVGGDQGVYLVGLVPGLLGVALLIYAFFLAGPVE